MMHTLLKRFLLGLMLVASALFLTGCEHTMVITNDLDEREANEIVVFLASRGIKSDKLVSTSTAPGAAEGAARYSISVKEGDTTEAMAILNQNGLPRKRGTNLLDLFAKSGLMSSEREETIRYQAGLAEQIANMIRKIDGVLDADVQLSFPQAEANIGTTAQSATGHPPKVTAAVYVKHHGILDDPNSHLVIKIKRLVAGSVAGLDVNDVAVISDRSRFADVTLAPMVESLEPQATKEYVSIWSIVMSKQSAGRFRFLFFFLTICSIVFALLIGWMIWKFYPILKRRGGFKAFFKPLPIEEREQPKPPEETK